MHPGQPLQTLAQDGIASLDELKAATREPALAAFTGDLAKARKLFVRRIG